MVNYFYKVREIKQWGLLYNGESGEYEKKRKAS